MTKIEPFYEVSCHFPNDGVLNKVLGTDWVQIFGWGWGGIIGTNSLPTIQELYAEVRHKES